MFVSQGSDGTRRLFTRRLDQPKAERLSGTEGAYTPFFSPDGQWVGFFARVKPDLVAPGNQTISVLFNTNNWITQNYPGNIPRQLLPGEWLVDFQYLCVPERNQHGDARG